MGEVQITHRGDHRGEHRAHSAMISVRIDPQSAGAQALHDVLGVSLPSASPQVSGNETHQVLWLGPDEWLIVSGRDSVELTRELTGAVAGVHAAIVDVSSNRVIIEIAGSTAREVLEKGCPLDLHPRAFGPGHATQTTLARVPLLLWQIESDRYRLLPRTSYAAYVRAWLEDAAAEFR